MALTAEFRIFEIQLSHRTEHIGRQRRIRFEVVLQEPPNLERRAPFHIVCCNFGELLRRHLLDGVLVPACSICSGARLADGLQNTAQQLARVADEDKQRTAGQDDNCEDHVTHHLAAAIVTHQSDADAERGKQKDAASNIQPIFDVLDITSRVDTCCEKKAVALAEEISCAFSLGINTTQHANAVVSNIIVPLYLMRLRTC